MTTEIQIIIAVLTLHILSTAITLGFTQIDYTAQEDTGIFQPGPVAIVKEGSRTSEQILSINVDFTPITAAAGTVATNNNLCESMTCDSGC